MEQERPTYFPEDAEYAGNLPFTPGFGSTPPCLVGRDDLIRKVCSLLAGPPASEGSANILLAPRGLGKTVALNEIEDAARRERGWIVLSVAGTDGDPIAETHKAVIRARRQWDESHGGSPNRNLSGVNVGLVGVSAGVSCAEESDPTRTRYGDDLRYDLLDLADLATQEGTRVLLTMDEMHAIPLHKARQLGSYIQHITKREKKNLVFVGAALPYITDTLLADKKSTFLRRLVVHEIGLLSEPDTRRGLAEPINMHGGSITADALDVATSLIGGHPYMLQLVGARMWETAGGAGNEITTDHAKSAASIARKALEDHLFAPTWQNLSNTDKRFLASMASMAENGDSLRTTSICEKAGIRATNASAYRRRLLLSGMVSPGGRGKLKLAHPSIGPWLRQAVNSGSVEVPETPLPGI